jgi:hypothetical protein
MKKVILLAFCAFLFAGCTQQQGNQPGVTFSVTIVYNSTHMNVTVPGVSLPLDEKEALIVANSTCGVWGNYSIAKGEHYFTAGVRTEVWEVQYSASGGCYNRSGEEMCAWSAYSAEIDETGKNVFCQQIVA